MEQVKIGTFLKTLRKEKNLSQEELADKFFVSVRTISRWENGNTLPDISVLIELADFYDVDIRDLLRGERKSDKMDSDMKETLEMVADYTEADKRKILNKVYICGQGMLICSVASMVVFFLINYLGYLLFFTPFLLILAGGIFAIITVLAGLQLKGRMSKERNRKLLKITIPVWVVITVIILIVTTYLFPMATYIE